MKILDLSHIINADMPVYPGTDKPQLVTVNSIDTNGFWETMLKMTSHTGTHLDAPAHVVANASTLDKLPLEQFYGLAQIIDVSDYAKKDIPPSLFESQATKLANINFIIIKSNHDRNWGNQLYFSDYPVLSNEAAEFLVKLPHLHGIGLDMISVDAEDSVDFPIHNIFAKAGKIIIENLTNLDAVIGDQLQLSVMPLKFADVDGSPTRAIAFVDE